MGPSSKWTVSSVTARFRVDSGTNQIKQGATCQGGPCDSVSQLALCSRGMRAVLGSSPSQAMCCFLPCNTSLRYNFGILQYFSLRYL